MAPGAFCQNCDFLQWGAWGARFGFGPMVHFELYRQRPSRLVGRRRRHHRQRQNGLPLQGERHYSGNAIGNVANNLNDQGWTTYVATGNMDMSWDFGRRSGQFDITNFDKPNTGGLDFGGHISMPGWVQTGPATGGLNKFSARCRVTESRQATLLAYAAA